MTFKTYKDIEYSLERSNRKTIGMSVERDYGVSLAAPKKVSCEDIDSIIESKRYWIYKAQAEQNLLNNSRVSREFVDGEGFLFLGKSYRLRLEADLPAALSLSEGYFLLNEEDISKGREVFKKFYKQNGLLILKERIEYFQNKLGIKPSSLRIMELKNRWASTSDVNSLNFNWKIFMAPLSVIDYIIVHEMAHMIENNHSDKFWSIVESVIPDFFTRKNWLRFNGANLDI